MIDVVDFDKDITEDDNDDTALIHASLNGHAEVSRLLLDNGADINARGRLLMTSLHGPSYFGHLDVVRLLLQRGAEVDPRDDVGLTPLKLAITEEARGTMTTIATLIRAGATVENARNSPWEQSGFDREMKKDAVIRAIAEASLGEKERERDREMREMRER